MIFLIFFNLDGDGVYVEICLDLGRLVYGEGFRRVIK